MDNLVQTMKSQKNNTIPLKENIKSERLLPEEPNYEIENKIEGDASSISDKMEDMVNSDGEVDLDKWKIHKKKKMEGLELIDHSKIEYEPFTKDFYEEHDEIANMLPEDCANLRQLLQIKIRGNKVPNPIASFNHLLIDDAILNKIYKVGYRIPTPIQCQCLPSGLKGRDLIGIAKTGSGKTLGYIIPMIIHILDQKPLGKHEGPIVLVLAPTRELCQQICVETTKFAKLFDLKCVSIIGGDDKTDQWRELKHGVEILIGTPGRIIDLAKKGAFKINLRTTFLVIDEADRMFDMGFEYQIRQVLDQIRPDRQILFFSATFNKKVENLTKDILTDPIKIIVGKEGVSNEDVTQYVHIMETEEEKMDWLIVHIGKLLEQGQILIFSNTILTCEVIYKNLNKIYKDKGKHSNSNKYNLVGLIHGDKVQYERAIAINNFRQGIYLIMIGTDVASRGLDIPMISTVLNFNCAKDNEGHIHRIGRTGRAGNKEGVAITLITKNEINSAIMLVKNFEECGQVVTYELESLANRDGSFKNSRQKIGLGSYSINFTHSQNINKSSKNPSYKKSYNMGIGYNREIKDGDPEYKKEYQMINKNVFK